ncbi:MAG: hypothetical protein JXP34_25650 [Planctomycetes bacterium]|nr:hypothetical protein [Planctomycetota bacterium]
MHEITTDRVLPEAALREEGLTSILERIRRTYQFRGVSEDRIRERLRRASAAYSSYRRVLEQGASNIPVSRISKLNNLSDRTVRDWLTGRRLPRQLDLRPDAAREVSVPADRSESFAYLLGVYAATKHSPSSHATAFRVSHREIQVIDRIRDAIVASFGDAPTIRKTSRGYDIFYGSRALAETLFEISAGNSRIPWEHVATVGERAAFLRGFLEKSGSVSATRGRHPMLTIRKRLAPDLLADLLTLSSYLGVLPTFGEDRLRIQTLGDLRRLLGHGCPAPGPRRDRLEKLVEAASFRSPDTNVELYYQATGRGKPEIPPGASKSGAGEVLPETRRSWRRGKVPRKVRRLERIAGLASARPDPEVIGFLCRRVGLTPEVARTIAARQSSAEVHEICALLKREKVDQEEWLEWLRLPVDEVRMRLMGWKQIRVKGKPFLLSPRARKQYMREFGLTADDLQDFEVCAEHIASELETALNGGLHDQVTGRKLTAQSKTLEFDLRGNQIVGIRIVLAGASGNARAAEGRPREEAETTDE